MKKRLLPLILLLLTASFSYAQSAAKSTRMVYLWDVTYSMHGGYFAPAVQKGTVIIAGASHTIDGYNSQYDIYDKTLEMLIEDINRQPENSEIVVIPFGKKVLDCWKEKGTTEGKEKLEENIRNFCDLKPANVQATGIANALEYARDYVFVADMRNVLKLMTDGRENVNVTKFHHILDNWCKYAKERNIDSYYFPLTEEALKGDADLKNRLEISCFSVVPDPYLLVKTYIFCSTDRINIMVNKESLNQPFELKMNVNAAAEGKTALVRFYVDNNPYLTLDETVRVSSETQSVSLMPKYKLSEMDMRMQMSTTAPTELPIWFSLAEEDENVELQSEKCVLSFINRELKKVTITVE